MRRNFPDAPTTWPDPTRDGRVSRTLHLEALTPIYKGGANPKGIDQGLPFRGPTLRGALRMWWRAISRHTQVDEIRAAEHQLFGGVFQEDTPRASRVSVAAYDNMSEPTDVQPKGFAYALWVDRRRGNNREPQYHLNASARVVVDAPSDQADEIDRALAAFLLVGAIGSRARRGLGAVWARRLHSHIAHHLGTDRVDDHVDLPSLPTVTAWADAVHRLAPPPGERSWPSLAGARLLTGPKLHDRAEQAVAHALDHFQELRGMRKENGSFTGRYREQVFQDNWLAVKTGNGSVGAAASLGLPLPYRSSTGHFRGARITKTSQQGENRLPSPVLLKPIPIHRNGRTRYAATVTVLRLWACPSVKVSGTGVRGEVDPAGLDAAVAGFIKRGWTLQGAQ